MGEKRRPRTASYRISLDRAVVCALRERAARETLAGVKTVSWLDLVRRAASQAVEGGAK